MIRYIDSADDVIACAISGIKNEELVDLINRIERSINDNERTHVFVEIDSFSGIDWRAVGSHVPRALPMLGNLKRFGRIAVVSDDPWIRRLTRIESALLPGISYEVFRSAERRQALAWVEGRAETPHGPALTLIETDDPSVIAFSYDGWLTADTLDDTVAKVRQRFSQIDGKFRVLARIGEIHFSELPPLLKREYVRFKIDALRRVDRYALVGGPEWLQTLAESLVPLFPFELRYFERNEEAEAWRWIGARPASAPSEARAAPAVADA